MWISASFSRHKNMQHLSVSLMLTVTLKLTLTMAATLSPSVVCQKKVVVLISTAHIKNLNMKCINSSNTKKTNRQWMDDICSGWEMSI